MPQLYICPYCKKALLSSSYHMFYHVDQECIYNKKNKNNIFVNNNEQQEVKQEKGLQKKEI